MIIISILSFLLSNAVNVRRDISILYNRIAILILIYCILNDISSLTVVTKGIGLHGGLLLITNITQIFHIFLFIVSILILTLTSFYPAGWFGKSPIRDKLLNSGDPLKLLIPSCNRKITSGWINYSCMVTSQKIFERKMGNRGSKSVVFASHENITVKEQRVDSNCINSMLRYTLTDFEIKSLIKIPSNQIINKRFYSTLTASEKSSVKESTFNPWFITGFTDGEGSFMIHLRKKLRYR